MDYLKVESFLRNHWPAALIVAVITIPAIWTIASTHFSQEIATLEERLKNLEDQVKVLEEYKLRVEALEAEKEKLDLIGGLVGFPPESLSDSLFWPSRPN